MRRFMMVGLAVVVLALVSGTASAWATAVGVQDNPPGQDDFLVVRPVGLAATAVLGVPVAIPAVNVTVNMTAANVAQVSESKLPLVPLTTGLLPLVSGCSYTGGLMSLQCRSSNAPLETILDGSTFDDRIDVTSPYVQALVNGGAGNDNITLTAGAASPVGEFSIALGGDGNDTLIGRHVAPGPTSGLEGGAGNDHLVSTPGPDALSGGPGVDSFDTADGDNADVIECPSSGEVIHKDPGDVIEAFPGCTP